MFLGNLLADKVQATIDLQNWRLKIFLNHDVFYLERPRSRTVDSDDTLEAATNDFIDGRVTVIYVSNADRVRVELFTRASCGRPPLLQLKYRHDLILNIVSI